MHARCAHTALGTSTLKSLFCGERGVLRVQPHPRGGGLAGRGHVTTPLQHFDARLGGLLSPGRGSAVAIAMTVCLLTPIHGLLT